MSVNSVIVRPVFKQEENKYKDLMQKHHYLGFVPKIGETMWYVATIDNVWVSLLGFSASALKCKVRDEWIGWSYRNQTLDGYRSIYQFSRYGRSVFGFETA